MSGDAASDVRRVSRRLTSAQSAARSPAAVFALPEPETRERDSLALTLTNHAPLSLSLPLPPVRPLTLTSPPAFAAAAAAGAAVASITPVAGCQSAAASESIRSQTEAIVITHLLPSHFTHTLSPDFLSHVLSIHLRTHPDQDMVCCSVKPPAHPTHSLTDSPARPLAH